MTEPRVHIVDDDEAMRDSLKWLLESRGLEVELYASGEEFLRRFDSGFCGCLVLDVRMPALGGDKVASVLSRMCSVPIVFYSAINDDEGEALAAEHQNASFVSKGTGLRRLAERLAEITGSGTSAVGL